MARSQRGIPGRYGPPEWDYSNKPYVNKALAQQQRETRRRPVYFSEWENSGRFMRRDNRMKSRLYREIAKILADLKGELRSRGGDMGREVADRLYVEYENNAGWRDDRPFFHLAERGAKRDRKFWFVDWRARFSDQGWHNYMSERKYYENKFGPGSYPDHDKYQDGRSIREQVIERYFVRNPEAYKYGRL